MPTPNIIIERMRSEDVRVIADAFAAIGWDRPRTQYEKYLNEQDEGERKVLVAWQAEVFVGYLTIIWQSNYPPFRADNIPEINDFNVLPDYRKHGIGNALMDRAEALVSERSNLIGIGVGMYPGYGSAQRLYVKRGYIPDGRGICYDGEVLAPMAPTVNDDSLNLYFTKQLKN